jgi:uncharacterized protein
LLRLIAANGQAELVKSHLARELGTAEGTVNSYLRTAGTMRLTVEFPAWSRSPGRRAVKRPKACLTDSGLAAALVGFTSAKARNLGNREYYGSLVEQFVALELKKQQTWASLPYDIYHYRDTNGLEIDLIIETEDGDIIAIEVKATATPTRTHWKSLSTFREKFPERRITCVLLHGGDTIAQNVNGWLHVLPIPTLWEHDA